MFTSLATLKLPTSPRPQRCIVDGRTLCLETMTAGSGAKIVALTVE